MRERFSGLSDASLHINDSLDCDTLLPDAVDSVRELVRSRYGRMAVSEARGRAATAL